MKNIFYNIYIKLALAEYNFAEGSVINKIRKYFAEVGK